MGQNNRLITDQDFQEASERQVKIRVFQNDQIVSSGVSIARFNEDTIVVQKGLSDVTYHSRKLCEFIEMRKTVG